MPESPWYLVRNGRYAEAERSARRITAEHEQPQAKTLIALIIYTKEIKLSIAEGISYIDCFKGFDIR